MTYAGTGVAAQSTTGPGMYAQSTSQSGVVGWSTSGLGVEGNGANGVRGTAYKAEGIGGLFDNGSGGQALSAQVNEKEKFGVYTDKTVVATNLQLLSSGTADTSAGYSSQPFDLMASGYNSGTGTSDNQTFRWLVGPAGNNTSSPAGTLNLQFGSGTRPPLYGCNYLHIDKPHRP